jgi:hypothetical protein
MPDDAKKGAARLRLYETRAGNPIRWAQKSPAFADRA